MHPNYIRATGAAIIGFLIGFTWLSINTEDTRFGKVGTVLVVLLCALLLAFGAFLLAL